MRTARSAYPLWSNLRVSIHAWVLHMFQTDRNAHVAEAGVAPPRFLMSSADFKYSRRIHALALALSPSIINCTLSEAPFDTVL